MGRRAGPRSRWRPDGRRRRTQGEIAKRKAKAAERAAQAAAQDQDQDPTDTEEDEDGPEREPVPADRDDEEADDHPPEHEPAGDSVEVLNDPSSEEQLELPRLSGSRYGLRPAPERGADMRHRSTQRSYHRSRSPARSPAPRRSPSWQVETSKAMSQILRHTGRVREDGYIPVTELLRHPRLRQAGATLTDIQEAVHANDKQRFQLSWQGRGHGRELLIRATQGHSQQQVQDDLLLTRITAPHEVPLAVHGTYFRHYSSIYHQGLRAGGDRGQRARKHVHFAMALPRDQHRATSGMRKDVEILLYLDIPRALRDNMRLYVSTNSVVLSEGFSGCIPIDYIMKVQYMHRHCANDVPGDSIPSPGRLKAAFAAIGVSPQEGSRGHSPAPERVPKSRRHSRKSRFDPCKVMSSLIQPPVILSDFAHAQVLSHPTRCHQAPTSAARPQWFVPSPFLFEGPLSPHPRYWQARPLLGRRRRSGRSSRDRLSSRSFLSKFVLDCFQCLRSQPTWFADFLQHFSIMYRPAGGPRQHYRPDGTRRRTAGELAKRAARAAAKAHGTDGAQPSQSDTPAMPKGHDCGNRHGSTAEAGASRRPRHGCRRCLPELRNGICDSYAGSQLRCHWMGRGPPPAPKQLEWVPKRTKAPPPGIGIILGGAQEAPAVPVRPATATEARPASPAKRSAPMPATAPTTTTTTTDQDITQAAPDGEPTLTTSLTLRMDAGQPQKKRRSKTVPPPNTAPALDALRLKWDLLLRVHEAAAEFQDADVPHLLHLYQAAGGYAARHHDFHLMRDKLMHEGVVGPSGVPLPLPPVGNYILSLGVSILGLQSSGYLPQISSSSTCGDLVEAWSLALWESSRRDLLEQLGELFTLLHSLVSNIPRRVYDSLPWRISLDQLTMVFHMWLGSPVAPALTDQEAAAPGPLALQDRLFRARSLSPRSGPLSESRSPAMVEAYMLSSVHASAEPGPYLQLLSAQVLAIICSQQLLSVVCLLSRWILLAVMVPLLHPAPFSGPSTTSWDSSRLLGCRRNPKARAASAKVRVVTRMLIFLCFCLTLGLAKGDPGSTAPTTPTPPAVDQQTSSATQHKGQPIHPAPVHAGRHSLSPRAIIRKRALRRAIGRATRTPTHTTTYRGRVCALNTLQGATASSTTRPAVRSRPQDTDHRKGPRLRAMTWNVGGLSQDAWLEVQIWLHNQEDYDLVFLQESHWRFTNSWCLPRFHVFHSGTSDHRFQGCMILVRKSLAPFEDIRWSTPLQGHLLHLRLPIKGRDVDLINVYQYAFHTGPDQAAVDGLARQAKPDHAFHLLRWRGGARHHPVSVSLPAIHYQTAPPAAEVHRNKAARYASEQPSSCIQAFRDSLAEYLPAQPTPEQLDEALQYAARKLLPASHGPPTLSVADKVQGTVKDMWTSRQVALRYAVDTLRPLTVPAQIRHWRQTGNRLWLSLANLFTAWKHQAQYLHLHRQLRKRGRQAKREVLDEQLQQAWQADRQGDKSNKSWRRNVLHYENVVTLVLEQELRAARVPEPELAVILNLHHCIGYWPAGQDPTTRVESERGVRQGCPLAPSLWTLITIALFRALAGVTSVTWLQEDTTMFADDLLLQWIVHRVQDLENMVDIIAHTFRILAQLGLQVQHRKTQLIVAYKGRQATQWWRAHTATTAEGRFLLIPQPGSKALRLPIVTKLTYLGIILSYVDATTATVDHRLQVAEAQRARLLKESSRALLERLNVEDPLLSLLQRPRIMHWLVHITESKLALTSHLAIAAASPTLLPGPLKGMDAAEVRKHSIDGLHEPTSMLQHARSFGKPASVVLLRVAWFHLPLLWSLLPIAMAMESLQMDLDQEEQSVFGGLLGKRALQTDLTENPTKYQHPGGKGPPPNRSSGTRQQQQPLTGRGRHAAPFQGSRGSDVPDNRNGPSKMPSGNHALLHRVAKALIVQADYLSRLQSDHTVIFTFRTGNGPQLMVPLLQEVATTWREQRQQNKVTRSLKQTLIQYLAAELVTRINAFAADTESQKKAQELGWTTSEGEFNFLDWDFEDKKLVPRQGETLTHDQLLTDAKRLKALLKNPDLVLKFSGGRNAKPDSTSETATFVLELSMQQPEASEAMAIFRKWYANSALLLLSLRLKPARPERSPLIKEIQEAVGW
ncbi:unnamed protein product [Symbiodinium sp. CCMP2592]|nr:unnamed protein product [Symbiodinium sp. CCMP2592]